MLGPHAPNNKHLHEFACRTPHGPYRPAPSGSTIWWTIKAVALVGMLMLGCVGFAGALQSAGLNCHDIGRRACLALVVDDLTGKTPPAPRSD